MAAFTAAAVSLIHAAMNDTAPAASPVEDTAKILGALPLFARLDPASLAAIAAHSGVAHYHPGDTIMQQGRMSTFADVILEGEVEVLVDTPAGQVRVATVGPHQIVGEVGAIAAMPRTATVVARTELTVLRIRRGSLINLTGKHPAIAATIVGELGRRLYGMNRSLAYLTYAANALGRDEYDAAMLAELTRQPGEVAEFRPRLRRHGGRDRREEAPPRRDAGRRRDSTIDPAARRWCARACSAPIDLHAEMHPAREIGGDFYDFFPAAMTAWRSPSPMCRARAFPAALFMAVSRTVLRSMDEGDDDMAARIERANRLLATENATAMFVTAFHGVLDLKSGVLRYCNAGHNPPYVLRADGGHETLRRPASRSASTETCRIASRKPCCIRGRAVPVQRRDHRGVQSGTATNSAPPGSKPRLPKCRRAAARPALVGNVLSATTAFAAGAEQSDDITCLALVYRP